MQARFVVSSRSWYEFLRMGTIFWGLMSGVLKYEVLCRREASKRYACRHSEYSGLTARKETFRPYRRALLETKLAPNLSKWSQNYHCLRFLLGAFAKFAKSGYSSCISPPAWKNSASTGWIFMKFDIWAFFEKCVEKIQLLWKSEHNGYFTSRRVFIYDNIMLNYS